MANSARPLKFRAWDGEQMISPDYIDRDGHAHWESNSIPQHSGVHGYPLMQNTGLLDKNGKEVWEGDILLCTIEGEPYSNKDVVQFSDGAFRMRHRTLPVYEWEMRIDGHEIEVIGNRFENPELLTGTQAFEPTADSTETGEAPT